MGNERSAGGFEAVRAPIPRGRAVAPRPPLGESGVGGACGVRGA